MIYSSTSWRSVRPVKIVSAGTGKRQKRDGEAEGSKKSGAFSAPRAEGLITAATRSAIDVALFPLNCFLNDGAPQREIAGMRILFRKMAFLCTWATGYIPRDAIPIFAEVGFRVRYGVP